MATYQIDTTATVEIDEESLAELIHDYMQMAGLLKVDERDNVPYRSCRTPHRNTMLGIAKDVAEDLDLE